jgi:hypothetical protein
VRSGSWVAPPRGQIPRRCPLQDMSGGATADRPGRCCLGLPSLKHLPCHPPRAADRPGIEHPKNADCTRKMRKNWLDESRTDIGRQVNTDWLWNSAARGAKESPTRWVKSAQVHVPGGVRAPGRVMTWKHEGPRAGARRAGVRAVKRQRGRGFTAEGKRPGTRAAPRSHGRLWGWRISCR